jgi:uncharacterized protein (TIGR03435 family)
VADPAQLGIVTLAVRIVQNTTARQVVHGIAKPLTAYSICLGFAPNKPGADPSASDLFEALREQLRLYLASEKAPVKVLVIDHIEPATPN